MNKTKNSKGTSDIALSFYSSCALSFSNPCLFGFKIDPEKPKINAKLKISRFYFSFSPLLYHW